VPSLRYLSRCDGVSFASPPTSDLKMSDLACLIPADPDVSGIGVRIAIYVQNLLSFVPAVWALLNDGHVSEAELESVETQSMTILITAFAILVTAMVEAQRSGLSNYHASVVLSLSWMNNTNTFIYFILYVHHKTHHRVDQVKPQFSAWIRHAWRKMKHVDYNNQVKPST
jgi:hypothetical protein